MKRSTVTLCTIGGVILAAIAIMIAADATLQSHITIDGESVGPFPVVSPDDHIELSPDLIFDISSTSKLSHVTPATLEWLRRRGCVSDSSVHPLIYVGADGKYRFATRFYVVDLPVARYTAQFDSVAGRNYMYFDPWAERDLIRNVEVVVDGAGNTLGNHFLERFAVEYNKADDSFTFHKQVPEGYERLGGITRRFRPSDIIGNRGRYFADIRVDHVGYSFKLNTSLDTIALKMPLSRISSAHDSGHYAEHLANDANGTKKEFVEVVSWIEFGNRAGSRRVHYFANGDNEMEFNPFSLFEQDVVVDFASGTVYLRPYYKIKNMTE